MRQACRVCFFKATSSQEMVRFTFVVGGGKKVRQKYNDGLPALLADALKKVGFQEDRGASLDISCAGTFKFQHNTDTDLKVTHVYPKIDPQAAAAAESSDAGPDPLSPSELIVYAEMATFQKMISAKCPSLGQKRKALDVIKAARAGLAASEKKLEAMVALTEDEQHRYDTLDASDLEAKQQWLSKQMDEMIDNGQLTAAEKETVLAQLASKIEQLEAQVASAEAEQKPKRAEKISSCCELKRAASRGRRAKVKLTGQRPEAPTSSSSWRTRRWCFRWPVQKLISPSFWRTWLRYDKAGAGSR